MLPVMSIIDIPCIENPLYLILYFILFTYTFVCCAILTEDYFVPALEKVAKKWNISPDVAGATLMAVGSSAPEISVNILDTIFGEADLGLDSVIGSSLFNICIITSASAFAAPSAMALNPKPFMRDFFFYLLAVCLLYIFLLDYIIYWYEAASLLSLYVCYIIFLMNNDYLLGALCCCCKDKAHDDKLDPLTMDNLEIGDNDYYKPMAAPTPAKDSGLLAPTPAPFEIPEPSEKRDPAKPESKRDPASVRSWSPKDVKSWWERSLPNGCQEYGYIVEECELDGTDLLALDYVSLQQYGVKKIHAMKILRQITAMKQSMGFPSREIVMKDVETGSEMSHHEHKGGIIHTLLLPVESMFYYTIPTHNPYICFVVSCCWIMIISYILIQLTKLSGCALNISLTLMGIIFLAGGTSIPDMLCSIAVSKKSKGDMAISNISGSNISNLLIGLGLPWTLSTILEGPHVVETDNLVLFVGFLSGALFISLFAFILTGFRLGKPLGSFLLIMYAVFIAFTIFVIDDLD
jgi:K+-dependent Na+/Ca+ exchanger-like protein